MYIFMFLFIYLFTYFSCICTYTHISWEWLILVVGWEASSRQGYPDMPLKGGARTEATGSGVTNW